MKVVCWGRLHAHRELLNIEGVVDLPKDSDSAENHSVFLVYQVFIEAPSDDAAEALARNAGDQAPKVAGHAVGLVYLNKGVADARVVLRLILVVVLKVGTRPDQVKWISNYTANSVCGKRGSRCDYCQVHCSVRLVMPLVVKVHQHHEVGLE